MKDLIVITSSIDEIKNLDADSFLIGNKYGVRTNRVFSKEETLEIKDIVSKRGKRLYILVNKIFLQDELDGLFNYLSWLKSIDVDGIFFSDLGVITMGEQLGIKDKLVYFSETQMVNHKDCEFFVNQGLKGVILSKELPLEDIITTSKLVKGNLGMIIHGYLHMFYSKRKILRNFFEKYNQEYEYQNKRTLKLKEQKRNEYYPIYEDENGSYIFSHGCMSSLNDFKEIVNSDLKMFIIDSIFLSKEHVKNALDYYKKILNGIDGDYQKLIEEEFKDVDFTTGFLHHQTGIYK